MIQVRLTHLAEDRIAQSALEEDDQLIEKVSKYLADEIRRRIKSKSLDDWDCFQVENDAIDDLAMKFTDVWIIGVAEHTEQYSATFATPKLADSSELPEDDVIQRSKSFSGDVSGIIGETMFTLVAKRYFELNENCFAHLRPQKNSEQPDFAVYLPSEHFLQMFKQRGLRASAKDCPIPCEVKAMSTAELPQANEIRNRIRKAMKQLHSFWRIRKQLGSGLCCGVICVAIRNPRNSYDVSFIWCN
jgi:hypothetical protein